MSHVSSEQHRLLGLGLQLSVVGALAQLGELIGGFTQRRQTFK